MWLLHMVGPDRLQQLHIGANRSLQCCRQVGKLPMSKQRLCLNINGWWLGSTILSGVSCQVDSPTCDQDVPHTLPNSTVGTQDTSAPNTSITASPRTSQHKIKNSRKQCTALLGNLQTATKLAEVKQRDTMPYEAWQLAQLGPR